MNGPDIFLTYNTEDSARAKQFADGFAAAELSVGWDVALRSGEAYDQVTEEPATPEIVASLANVAPDGLSV